MAIQCLAKFGKILCTAVLHPDMKCRGCSETGFLKVSDRTESFFRGKQPFKVCIFFDVSFRFFGVILAAKRRTAMKICQQIDLEVPDVLFHGCPGPARPKSVRSSMRPSDRPPIDVQGRTLKKNIIRFEKTSSGGGGGTGVAQGPPRTPPTRLQGTSYPVAGWRAPGPSVRPSDLLD